MNEATGVAVRERLGTGRTGEAIAILEAESAISPHDHRIAHDRLLVATLFGPPEPGRAALDHLLSVVEKASGRDPAMAGQIHDDLVDLAPLVLARFGTEDLAVLYMPPVAQRIARLLGLAARLPQSGESVARREKVDGLIWTHDDPRTGVTRHVYRPRSPHTLQIEPTNRCNLKCTMCPRTTAMQRPLVDMSVERYARLLEGWSAVSSKFQIRVHAFGSVSMQFTWPGFVKLFFLGEILMHEDFDRLVHKTVSRGAAVAPMTNGALLVRRSIRRKIVESEIATLGISIDGIDAAGYAAVREGATWPVVRDAVLALCDELEAAGRRSKIRIHIHSLIPEGAGNEQRNRDFLAPLIARVDGHNFGYVTALHPAEFVDGEGRLNAVAHRGSPIHPSNPSCFETLTKLNVLSDGRMTPCCPDIDGAMTLGSTAQTVDEVWNSPATLALHRAHLTHRLEDYDFCRDCLNVDSDPGRGLVVRAPLESVRAIG
jgi:hypothetical protein